MDEPTPESWRAIPGFEGLYDASSHGRIKSLPRCGRAGCVLKPRALPSGYLEVTLYRHGKRSPSYVHQLVAAAFIGPCPPGQEVRHKRPDPSNNRPSNLRYGTHKQNQEDMAEDGHSIGGERHPFTHLTNEDAQVIRVAWQQGERGVDLAAQYRVSKATITRIVKGRTFRDGEILERPRGICRYPGCDELAENGTDLQGKALAFCPNPGHNNLAAKRERKRMSAEARRVG